MQVLDLIPLAIPHLAQVYSREICWNLVYLTINVKYRLNITEREIAARNHDWKLSSKCLSPDFFDQLLLESKSNNSTFGSQILKSASLCSSLFDIWINIEKMYPQNMVL